MARLIEFRITVEIEEDDEVCRCELEEVMSEMENICAKRNYGLYDAQLFEDDEPYTDELVEEKDVSDMQEHEDFAQDNTF